MALYPRPRNGGVLSRHPLLLVPFLIFLSLLGGCSASTTTGSPPTTTSTRELKGRITEFPLPASDSSPGGITTGPDGNLWFTEDQEIGRITPSGHISKFPLYPLDSHLVGITTGPDGNLWFTEILPDGRSGAIGSVTPSGHIREFPLPVPDSLPGGITAGPDGNLWFTETTLVNVQIGQVKLVGKIGRITPAGHISEFPLLTPYNQPVGITAGPDGNIWFTEGFDLNATRQSSKIGRITPAGHISEFPLSPHDSDPIGITTGPDGAIWFTELHGKIGRLA